MQRANPDLLVFMLLFMSAGYGLLNFMFRLFEDRSQQIRQFKENRRIHREERIQRRIDKKAAKTAEKEARREARKNKHGGKNREK